MVAIVAEQVNLKFLIDAELRERLDGLLERKKISLTAGMSSLIEWLLSQDSLVQSVALGQLDRQSSEQILSLMLRKLQESESEGPPGGRVAVTRKR